MYRILLDIYRSENLKDLTDPNMTVDTREAAGVLIHELSRLDIVSNVSENFMRGGILKIIQKINRESETRLFEINRLLLDQYKSFMKQEQNAGSDLQLSGIPAMIDRL